MFRIFIARVRYTDILTADGEVAEPPCRLLPSCTSRHGGRCAVRARGTPQARGARPRPLSLGTFRRPATPRSQWRTDNPSIRATRGVLPGPPGLEPRGHPGGRLHVEHRMAHPRR